jgi:adenylate kinase family enzyme
LQIFLGRLLERTEVFGIKLDALDEKMDRDHEILLDQRDLLRHYHDRLTSLEETRSDDEISPWERRLKRVLTWMLPLLVAYGTGSIDAVMKMLEAIN